MVALPHGKCPHYTMDMRLGGPQRQSGCGEEEKKSHHRHSWVLNPSHSTHSLLTVLTGLGTDITP